MSDPSMEDILASIRKILADETVAEENQAEEPQVEMQPEPAPAPVVEPVVQATPDDDVFDLSNAQIVTPAPAPAPTLVAQPVAKASACTLSYLAQMIAEDKKSSIGNGGLTIEEIVKETIRPIIKEWLNQNLYDMVERLVRKEIEKVADKVDV